MTGEKSNKQSKGKWFEIKHEYDIVDGKRVLTRVTEERKNSEWYNSGIFLWFLGALFLTFIPWGWSGYKSYKEQINRVEKLDNEMANRLDQMIAFVARGIDSTRIIATTLSNTELYKVDSFNVEPILRSFIGTPALTSAPKFYSSYKEFEDVNTVSLLYELHGLEIDEKQRCSLQRVTKLLATSDLIPLDEKNISVKDKNKAIEELRDTLYLNRWRK